MWTHYPPDTPKLFMKKIPLWCLPLQEGHLRLTALQGSFYFQENLMSLVRQQGANGLLEEEDTDVVCSS